MFIKTSQQNFEIEKKNKLLQRKEKPTEREIS